MEDIKEKTADEMFEELEYKKQENETEIRYIKKFELKRPKHIIFFNDKTISVCEENERELAVRRDYFSIQELKAINKKVEELKW